MSFIRNIDKIKDFIGHCTLWNLGNRKRKEQAPFYFMDGLIAINSDESMYIGYNQPTLYAFNISEALELRSKYGIKDKDVFLGRDENYLLFRNGNLTIKTKDLIINADKIIFNGIEITVASDIISIAGKPVAVVGGDISTVTNKITTSGQ